MVANATPENVSLHSWSMRSLRMLPFGFALCLPHKVCQPFFLFFLYFLGRGDSCHSINGSSIWTSLSQIDPSNQHFGTPFSHKHFNEKYQRNCFRNCFICHKQNACQISLMLFMCILWRTRPTFPAPYRVWIFKAFAKFSPPTYFVLAPPTG